MCFNACFFRSTVINQPPPLFSIFFLHLFQKRNVGDKWQRFSWKRCPSCDSTNNVKAQKEIQSTDPNQWPGLILSSPTIIFLKEGVLVLYASSPTPATNGHRRKTSGQSNVT